jgi:hypothetical protein
MLFWGRGVLKLMEENLFVRFIAALVWGDESYFSGLCIEGHLFQKNLCVAED